MQRIRINISRRGSARKGRVFVGMSGGVDSSVSAALLQRAGADVTGVFIKVWQPDWIECDWKQERLDAMRAAAHLDIPFVTLDLEKEYKEGVIDYMLREYAAGRTPNPDVMCNREVKFGAFWRWAREQGADYVATGHYAQNETGADGHRRMLVSRDLNKDQTYFLWTLGPDDLDHILFPVGGMTKDEVRAAARRFGLPNAEKKDSQGLCFIGKIDVKGFLSRYIDAKAGKIIDETGKEIGSHPGALLFTIGERHGFTIDGEHKTPADRPYYVIGKDAQRNVLIVSNTKLKDPESGLTAEIQLANWTSQPPAVGDRVLARSRYRETLQEARIEAISTEHRTAVVRFDAPQATLASGQSLVVYRPYPSKKGDGMECLGGGVIV